MKMTAQALEQFSGAGGDSEPAANARETMAGITGRSDRQYLPDCRRRQEFTTALWDKMGEPGRLGIGLPESAGAMGGGLAEAAPLNNKRILNHIGEHILHLPRSHSARESSGREDKVMSEARESPPRRHKHHSRPGMAEAAAPQPTRDEATATREREPDHDPEDGAEALFAGWTCALKR